MGLKYQIFAIVYSFIFGIIFGLCVYKLRNYLFFYNKPVSYLFNLFFVLFFSIFYFLGIFYINGGILHIYFFIILSLGLIFMIYFMCKRKM